MLEFRFKLSSKFYSIEELSIKYSLDYLNDWLSYESELKYLFFFGESNNSDDNDLTNLSYPKCLEDIICLLRHNNILCNEDKHYILSLYIEDAYVSIDNGIATLHIKLESEYKKIEVNSRIIQFLLNHIYNQCNIGIFKNGLIQPLTNEDKLKYMWIDEVGWSYRFLNELKQEENILCDTLYFSDFTFITEDNSLIPTKPFYISNYNLECFQISKCIDSVNNDIHRYKKSIRFLEKKKKDLKKEKYLLYKIYRDSYLNMLDNDNKKWHMA
jgi:hypothetical protein